MEAILDGPTARSVRAELTHAGILDMDDVSCMPVVARVEREAERGAHRCADRSGKHSRTCSTPLLGCLSRLTKAED